MASTLRVAIGRDYDRTRSLLSEEGPVVCTVMPSVHDSFRAISSDSPFLAAETSTAFYIAMCCHENPPVVALPIFPSRSFRYGNLFVRSDSPLERVEELRGKRVGLGEYGMTMGVWLRGIISEIHGVQPNEIEWITTREPVLVDMPASVRAAGIRVSRLPSGSLWEALEHKRIDAAIGVVPKPSLDSALFRRLRRQYWEDDLAYFRRTGNFPIMHTLVIRRHLVEENPSWVKLVFDAFCKAKRKAVVELENCLATLSTSLPMLPAHVDLSRHEFGANWWSYGFEQNRQCIETLLRYCFEQGVVDRQMSAAELFHPDSLTLVDEVETPDATP